MQLRTFSALEELTLAPQPSVLILYLNYSPHKWHHPSCPQSFQMWKVSTEQCNFNKSVHHQGGMGGYETQMSYISTKTLAQCMLPLQSACLQRCCNRLTLSLQPVELTTSFFLSLYQNTDQAEAMSLITNVCSHVPRALKLLFCYILGFQLKKTEDGNKHKRVKENKVSVIQGKLQPIYKRS